MRRFQSGDQNQRNGQLSRPPEDADCGRKDGVQRRHQSGGRVHQPRGKIRTLEGHRLPHHGRTGAELHPHVHGVLERVLQIQNSGTGAGTAGGGGDRRRERLCAVLLRFSGRRGGYQQHAVCGAAVAGGAVCVVLYAVSDAGRHAHGCLCPRGTARCGCSDHHAGCAGQKGCLPDVPQLLCRPARGGCPDFRVHTRIRPCQGLCDRRRRRHNRHGQSGLPQSVPAL